MLGVFYKEVKNYRNEIDEQVQQNWLFIELTTYRIDWMQLFSDLNFDPNRMTSVEHRKTAKTENRQKPQNFKAAKPHTKSLKLTGISTNFDAYAGLPNYIQRIAGRNGKLHSYCTKYKLLFMLYFLPVELFVA